VPGLGEREEVAVVPLASEHRLDRAFDDRAGQYDRLDLRPPVQCQQPQAPRLGKLRGHDVGIGQQDAPPP
jgi:hypothetical protein